MEERVKFSGNIRRAVIYTKFDIYYALSDTGVFFRISANDMKKIPRRKKVPKTPINYGEEFIALNQIRDGRRIAFEALKEPRDKHRWAENIRLVGLGELY